MRKTKLLLAAAAVFAMFQALPATAEAAPQCSNTSAGFDQWVVAFKQEAAANGVSRSVLDKAFANVVYNRPTISADRGQKSFKLSFDAFMQKRGGQAIISRGKGMKRANAALFANIERKYGVPAGPLIAIWGMETGFGSYMGTQHTMSAVSTLAFDCRRTAYFTDQLYAALQLVGEGFLSPQARGAAHGEIGQTQFLPRNVVLYGADGDGDGRVDMVGSRADALASTANFLKGHGWRPGAGYQPGEPNFAAISGWNAATVYQQAIAYIGQQIDAN
ncbi:lytic murein transglycosylase [Rhizobium sp. 2MFCol3.1]|uniref:lytic murein transglycosylase n=1 Tax=Rhizobium sp. 2MFCol3.1 TaxID=1246459 RepID=UPI0003609B4E|nr:lytic murein transglycosylase [Rhizobium sp. 2MFCol3.1]